jgi:hypothetical protein
MRLVFTLVVLLGCSHAHKPVETAHLEAHAARIGARAPDVQMTTTSGTAIAMRDVLRTHDQTIVVFYRGFY